MSLSWKEIWTVIHGMVLGAIFLVAFAGGLAGLWSLRPEWVTPAGAQERLRRLRAGATIMAATAWLTVITGTYLLHPWYDAPVKDSPRALLLANPATRLWHTFGMEWKAHVGWVTPILATAVAYIIAYYGEQLEHDHKVRTAAMILFSIAFLATGIAGLLGHLLNKVAPVR
ncbi:MAG: hypothetical protein HY660_18110 [Armatimonadetes bacterium]|nr:hypothetical protein [Armatimonadota bacterium]